MQMGGFFMTDSLKIAAVQKVIRTLKPSATATSTAQTTLKCNCLLCLACNL